MRFCNTPLEFPSAASVTPVRQMVRACSYEVGGDVTNPRLASLIERAKAASVPKVSRHNSFCRICHFVVVSFRTQSIIERAVAKGLGLGKGGEEVPR